MRFIIIKRKAQVSALISELKPLVQEIGDATLIVPLIKEYLDISVKNDDQLVKLATIVQRVVGSGGNEDSMDLSDEEKAQLLQEIDKLNHEDNKNK